MGFLKQQSHQESHEPIKQSTLTEINSTLQRCEEIKSCQHFAVYPTKIQSSKKFKILNLVDRQRTGF